MAPGLAKVAPDLPKDGLRAVLGFLGDDWKTVGRASLVSKTWKVTIGGMESSVWQAAHHAPAALTPRHMALRFWL